MRPLTEEETKTLFLKLSEYIGKSIERLINRSDERHCFRLLKVSVLLYCIDDSYATWTLSNLFLLSHFLSFVRTEFITLVNRS